MFTRRAVLRAGMAAAVAGVALGSGVARAADGTVTPDDQERTAAATSSSSNWYRVTTLNIRSHSPEMSAAQVQHDVDRAVSLGSDIVMFQEISPRVYKAAVKKWTEKPAAADGSRWRVVGLETENPILLRVGGSSPWYYYNSGVTKTHDGKKHISPTRYYTWLVVTNKWNKQHSVVFNTHMVSGAWNNEDNGAEAWRKQMWNKHFGAMQKRIAATIAQGYPVVVGGDFNRNPMPVFNSAQQWVAGSHYDWIGYQGTARESAPKIYQAYTTGGLYSDHHAQTAVFAVQTTKAGA